MRIHNSVVCSRVNDSTRITNLMCNSKFAIFCLTVVLVRRIYTTFILGTALLNFSTQPHNIGHGLLDFCRVKENFSARVPKNLGEPRPPYKVVSASLKRGPRAETRGILVPRVFALITGHESQSSGVENRNFRGKKDGLEESEEWWHNSHLEQRCHRHVNRAVVGGK